jgi:TRAP-type C4-dicarboxylate transport system permease small subunit
VLDRLEAVTLRVTHGLALAAVAGLLLVAAATVADVTLRHLLGKPIRGYAELAALLTAVVVTGFLPAMIAQRGNLAIRFLGDLLGPRATRLLDAFGALAATAFFALMAWRYVLYSAEMWRGGERLAILRWSVAPWWWAVTVMIALAALASLVVFLSIARGRQPPGDSVSGERS